MKNSRVHNNVIMLSNDVRYSTRIQVKMDGYIIKRKPI